MKIALFDPSVAGQDVRERRAAGEAHQARWRAELELAQWRSRQRYRPQPAEVPKADAAAVARVMAGPALSRGGDAVSTGSVARSEPVSAVPEPAVHAPSAGHSPVMHVAGLGGAVDAEPRVSVLPAALRLEAGPARASLVQKAAMPSPPETFHWPATASHVSLQGNRLNVALRDAGLDERDWPALRDRLQAQCVAWGLELGELTINGKRVEPIAGNQD